MKIAFSKPTRDLAGQRALFGEFGPAGYAGLQLKGGQYGDHVADPAGFTAAWGDDPALTSALITMGTLDEAGVVRLRQIVAFAAATGSERVVFCQDHPRAGVTPADLRSFARTLSAAGRASPIRRSKTGICRTASSGPAASLMAVKAMTATAESSGSGSGHAPRPAREAGRGSASRR